MHHIEIREAIQNLPRLLGEGWGEGNGHGEFHNLEWLLAMPVTVKGTARWFAVFCKPRQEQIAQENLLRQGFRVYLPRIRLRKHCRGKWVERVEALFPRYLFIHLNPEVQSIAPVRSTRGAIGLVNFAGKPAVVANEVIAALLQCEDHSGLHLNEVPPYRPGDKLRLLEGSLAGMEGIFVQEDGGKRVVILLELLGRANAVKVDPALVSKVE